MKNEKLNLGSILVIPFQVHQIKDLFLFWLFLKAQQHGIHSALLSDTQKSLLLTGSSLYLLVKADQNIKRKTTTKPKTRTDNKPFPNSHFAITLLFPLAHQKCFNPSLLRKLLSVEFCVHKFFPLRYFTFSCSPKLMLAYIINVRSELVHDKNWWVRAS